MWPGTADWLQCGSTYGQTQLTGAECGSTQAKAAADWSHRLSTAVSQAERVDRQCGGPPMAVAMVLVNIPGDNLM